MEKKKHIYAMALIAAVWLTLAVWCWLRPSNPSSVSERRPLAQFPGISVENLTNGSFMEKFEDYTLDQFPLRDTFRRLKAGFHTGVLLQKDNNGIYITGDQAAKLEYPLSEPSVDHALAVMKKIREKYLQDSRVFLSVIPDKGYYLAEPNGYPAMDYEKLLGILADGMEDVSYVNLIDRLNKDSYYATDTHWRQEKLLGVAERLCEALGVATPKPEDFRPVMQNRPFYGVYYGQAALPMAPDELVWMESELLKDCKVYNYETGKYGSVYDSAKLEGNDLYETFLSGPVSLLTIENPHAETDKELIIFRDSFGSSIAPLLVQGYKTVTLVDVRYISSAMLDRFIDFHGQDVLFLYSTLVLNNSNQMQ